MSQNENILTVQKLFEAFGKGDIPTVVGMMTDDVDWLIQGSASVPYTGPRQGRDEVMQCFAALGQAVEFESFEPRRFAAQDDLVFVLGHERYRVRATERIVDHEWVMVFTLRDGQVSEFRSFEDSAAAAEAFA